MSAVVEDSVSNAMRMPGQPTLTHAIKLAIVEDRPIMFDYWVSSLEKKAVIGVHNETNQKLLVKSEDEYTSPISKLYKVDGDSIILTENSLYIVSADIQTKKIA